MDIQSLAAIAARRQFESLVTARSMQKSAIPLAALGAAALPAIKATGSAIANYAIPGALSTIGSAGAQKAMDYMSSKPEPAQPAPQGPGGPMRRGEFGNQMAVKKPRGRPFPPRRKPMEEPKEENEEMRKVSACQEALLKACASGNAVQILDCAMQVADVLYR
jgi:hypothetical protein